MPTFYNFRENGVDYSFDDVFVPADMFREGNLWVWGTAFSGVLGTNDDNITKSTPVTTFSGGANWKSIGRGLHVMGGIKTDGTLWNTGRGASGDLGTNNGSRVDTFVTTFAGGTNWKQVDYFVGTGAAHGGISVKTDGTLWVWGDNAYGTLGTNDTGTNRFTPVTTFAGGTNWKQVAGGQHFVGAIKTDGTLWVWGRNQLGQLGTNDTTNRSTPVTTFAGGTNWKQIGLGASATHISAIKTDGTLWTWGNGGSGQLGNNDVTNRSTPVTTFAGGTNWKQTNAGSGFTGAIKTDGTLWTWGNTLSLGRFNDGTILTPITTFAGGTNWADAATTEPEDLYTLSSGFGHTAAIKTDGTLWTWGYGTSGRLGNAAITTISIPVTTFAGGTNWKQVSSGSVHTAAIKTDGTLWTWGYGASGRLGNAVTTGSISTPVTTFAGGTNWKQVSSGSIHTAAIKTDGTLWTWGGGGQGRLGNGVATFSNISTPVTTFAGGTNWKQVSAGGLHTAAIKTDGTLWTWGFGNNGRLGNAVTSGNISTPVTTFAGGTNWKQVSSGGGHTAAIKTDGTLWTWGYGTSGQLGNGVTTGSISTPVTTFAGGTDWKQVSSGNVHTAAIKTDGTLWTWGFGGSGQLGTNDVTNRSTPVTTFAGGTNWKQVSSGNVHTAALRDDGVNKELYLFGSNSSFQLGVYTDHIAPGQVFGNSTNWKQISTNTNSCAIKTDGTLWTWGFPGLQLGINDISSGRNTPVTTFLGGSNWKQCDHGAGMVAITYDDPVL